MVPTLVRMSRREQNPEQASRVAPHDAPMTIPWHAPKPRRSRGCGGISAVLALAVAVCASILLVLFLTSPSERATERAPRLMVATRGDVKPVQRGEGERGEKGNDKRGEKGNDKRGVDAEKEKDCLAALVDEASTNWYAPFARHLEADFFDVAPARRDTLEFDAGVSDYAARDDTATEERHQQCVRASDASLPHAFEDATARCSSSVRDGMDDVVALAAALTRCGKPCVGPNPKIGLSLVADAVLRQLDADHVDDAFERARRVRRAFEAYDVDVPSTRVDVHAELRVLHAEVHPLEFYVAKINIQEALPNGVVSTLVRGGRPWAVAKKLWQDTLTDVATTTAATFAYAQWWDGAHDDRRLDDDDACWRVPRANARRVFARALAYVQTASCGDVDHSTTFSPSWLPLVRGMAFNTPQEAMETLVSKASSCVRGRVHDVWFDW